MTEYKYDLIYKNKAYKYAQEVVSGEKVSAKYVIKVCQKFLDDLEDPDCKYFLDEKDLKRIEGLTKLINMSTGLCVGTPSYEALAGFQWFFLVNALCWKHKDNPVKRRYEKSVLLIARKNGKSFLVGLIFLLLMLIEPEFSEFYSVAPDKELSSIVKKEVQQMIDSSPHIQKYFKPLRTEIRCELKKSKFVPLACSENRMDGRLATVFVADEVGALKNRYPISAMESSQMNLVNRTGILISTAYQTLNNPMQEEIEYAQKVIDGLIEDDTLFALLYKPDDEKQWLDDDQLMMANPLMFDLPANLEKLKQQRAKAVEMPSELQNFLTKHMNIFVDGDISEVYVSTDDLVQCRAKEPFDWDRKEVYVGVDFALSNDNCGISMTHYDKFEDKLYSKSWAFIPADRMTEKSKLEKVEYRNHIRNGECFAIGDRIVDYAYMEEFVANLETEYGVIIKAIGYDKYNATSSANKWYNQGLEVIEVPQRALNLHPATKWLKESIIHQNFSYEKNRLLEINFANAREMTDQNLNSYLNKKKSTGKIDMVASLINSIALWEIDIHQEGESVYEDLRKDENGEVRLLTF